MICRRYALLGLLAFAELQAASHDVPLGNSAGRRKALHEAIEAQNAERVGRLLADGVNVNEDFLSRIPLHDAVHSANEAIIKMLVEAGADVNRQDSDGRTALDMYVGFAHEHWPNAKDVAVVELLLARGARVDIKDQWGRSPIDGALARSRPDLVKVLLAKVMNMTIHQAAYVGQWGRIEPLLDNGADINEKDGEGRTPLYHAACLGNQVDVVRHLLARGANVNLGDKTFTPLYGAVYHSHYDVAKVLIDNGADVNVRQHEGMTPLHLAIEFSYTQNPTDIIEYLLAHGARADLRDNQGNTPLDTALASHYRSDIVTILLCKIQEKTIHEAAHAGQWERIESLLGAGTHINLRDRSGRTALHHAVWGNQVDVAERLIAKGAEVDMTTDSGLTPLHVATMCGYSRIAELLLRQGASVNPKDKSGETPLHKAASGCMQEGTWPYELKRSEKLADMVELLLAHGADVNGAATDQQDTALHRAACFGSVAIAKLLVKHGADVKAKDRHGRTPLFDSIQAENGDLVAHPIRGQQEPSAEGGFRAVRELMLGEGAEVDTQDDQGRTPLHYAAECGYPEVVRTLLSRGADVNARDNQGQTPLLLCRNRVFDTSRIAEVNHLDTAKLLVTHGADVNAKDNGGDTALTLALKDDDPNLAQVLIDQGANVNVAIDSGRMPLHLALDESNEEMALLLIDKGASIHAPVRKYGFDSLHGSTPLHLAAHAGCIRVVSKLIEKGADVNAVNDSGRTPLHVAIEWSNEDIALLLIAKGADIHASIGRTTSAWLMGATPLHLTAREGCIQVAAKLIEKGVNVNAVNGNGATTAHLAIEYNCPGLLELLLRNGANIHLEDKAGDTLLRAAARRYRTDPDVISSLISRGATMTPTIRSLLDHGKTQLQLAVEANDIPQIAALTKQEYFKEQIHLRCHRLPNSPSPLATAVSKGYTQTARLLIQHGANVNETDSAEQSLLFHAARANNTGIAQALIDGGANVNQGDMFEETPLHQAAWLGHKEMVQLLLRNGANVNAVMRTKGQGAAHNACFTALHNAVLGRRPEVVKLLIANQAQVNAKDARGLTPLDQAIMQGDATTIRILEAAGAMSSSR